MPPASAATARTRPISMSYLRAFDAVARHLNFRAAAEEMALTQSAVSRQIQALEHEVGTSLFLRHTRSVELSSAGSLLHRSASASLERIDSAVRQIRQNTGRQSVSITTWASFASMWLIPRLEAFQREHPDIDIRIDATDAAIDMHNTDVDLALRYAVPAPAMAGAERLFGEQLTVVASPWLLKNQPIQNVADLMRCTLIEAGDAYRTQHMEWLSWQRWLDSYGHASPATDNAQGRTNKRTNQGTGPLCPLSPARWLYFNYAHQIVQAALTGQGVALARLPLVAESLANGGLVEVLPAMRLTSPLAYWLLIAPRSSARAEVRAFCDWLRQQASDTRHAIGDVPDPQTLATPD
ncbi:LysR substrate-binding domain-containing protein [Limnohabitans sp. DM1]|uniref:LysR substrate-binding domain-containing protein n=1 Tax=Limnohabitans sp. DM1 TaxID=1597955 RepID=UPI000B7DA9F7|nr:LysR substrate-binding domain-containing protein [Limnohabitans sp. DM1]